jgi:hypothetical protein
LSKIKGHRESLSLAKINGELKPSVTPPLLTISPGALKHKAGLLMLLCDHWKKPGRRWPPWIGRSARQ